MMFDFAHQSKFWLFRKFSRKYFFYFS